MRYLELAFKRLDRRQLKLVVDALHERKVVMDLAPHLAKPLTLVTPLFRPLEIPYYTLGLKLYDLLAGKRRLAPSRYLPLRRWRGSSRTCPRPWGAWPTRTGSSPTSA